MKNKTNKIIPHFWFDKEAREAAEFYVSLFPDSKISNVTTISDTQSGNVDIVSFNLWGSEFMSISAGPMFKINESISLFVYCGSEENIVEFYNKLSENGSVLMPLDKYDWSSKYAWVKDKFGLSWQLTIEDINSAQKILPSFLFVNEKSLRLKEAIIFYESIFPNSKIIMEAPYDKSANVPEGSLLFAQFQLAGYLFNSMSSVYNHEFDFNEAISFMVYCDSQEEIDFYWDKLTADGIEQPCGWLKDKYGISWQIIPTEMNKMMLTSDKDKLSRVTQAMLKMKKFDISVLKNAYENKL